MDVKPMKKLIQAIRESSNEKNEFKKMRNLKDVCDQILDKCEDESIIGVSYFLSNLVYNLFDSIEGVDLSDNLIQLINSLKIDLRYLADEIEDENYENIVKIENKLGQRIIDIANQVGKKLRSWQKRCLLNWVYIILEHV